MGPNVNFECDYAKLAETLHVNVCALNEQQKRAFRRRERSRRSPQLATSTGIRRIDSRRMHSLAQQDRPSLETPPHGPHRERMLTLIALFKVAKAAFFVAVGFGVIRLMRPAFAERAEDWVSAISSSHLPVLAEIFLARASGLRPRQLQALGAGAFLYAALFLTKGVGLWVEQRWAEYLTVIATASLTPFEVYELARRLTIVRIGALAINLGVVAYLITLHAARAACARPRERALT
jgi:uncharacterized membrane protein (DUF2068 family)